MNIRGVLSLLGLVSVPLAAETFDEPDFLYLEPFLEKIPLQESIETLTFDYEMFYFPLSELASMLSFALTFDEQKQQWSGWVLSEQNQFMLDINTRESWVRGELKPTTYQAFYQESGEIYIHQLALQEWFGIETETETIRQLVNFTTAEEHPLIARIKRKKAHEKILLKRLAQKRTTLMPEQYQWYTPAKIDSQLQLTQDKGKELTPRWSANGAMDMAWFATDFSLSAAPGTRSGRVRWFKDMTWQDVPVHLELGDVYGLAIPFSGGSSSGRGVALLSSDDKSTSLLSRRFQGNAPEGWEAELFRGVTVVDFLTVGADQQYVFDNVPASFGFNDYRVVLYGPLGERREIDHSFTEQDLGVLQGEWQPEISWVQPGQSMLFNTGAGGKQTFSAQLSYGLFRQLAVSLGMSHAIEDEDTETTVSASLQGFTRNSVWLLNMGQQQQSGNLGLSLSGRLTLWGYDLGFSYSDLRRYNEGDQSLNLNSSLEGDWGSVSMGVGWFRQPGDTERNLSLQYALNHQAVSFNLVGQFSDNRERPVTGSLSASSRFSIGSFRYYSTFHKTGGFRVEKQQLSWNGRWNRNRLSSRLDHQLEDDEWRWSFTFGRQFSQFALSAQLFADSEHDRGISLRLTSGFDFSQSLLPTKSGVKNTASIRARAFLDKDYNRAFSAGDEWLSGVGFSGQSQWRDFITDESGTVMLPGAKTSGGQALSVDLNTLDDPMLYVESGELSVENHAGGISDVQFAVIQTLELEGEVMLKNDEGDLVEKGGVPLLLIADDGVVVNRTRSEMDGFYLFDMLKPATYRIEVAEDYLARKQLQQQDVSVIDLTATEEGAIVPSIVLESR